MIKELLNVCERLENSDATAFPENATGEPLTATWFDIDPESEWAESGRVANRRGVHFRKIF